MNNFNDEEMTTSHLMCAFLLQKYNKVLREKKNILSYQNLEYQKL